MASSASTVDYSVINSDNKWHMLTSQRRFACWACWVSLGVVMQGFDIVGGSQLAALTVFQKKFGVQQPDGSYIIPARYLSAFNSIASACEIVSTFVFAPLLEKYGRKPQILAAAFISVTGVLLQQVATDWKIHLAGRGINGVAIGMMFTISPLWIGESSRPELRGFFLCFFNASIVLGQFTIVAISKGSSGLDDKWQWWVPVTCMYFFPLALMLGWPFFPESPYWLLRQGRVADAEESLRWIYGSKDDSLLSIEIDRMNEDIQAAHRVQDDFDQTHGTVFGIDFSAEAECFRGTNLKRTLTAICLASGQQLLGAAFVIGNATYFLDLVGVKNFFDASVVLYVVMLLASCAAFPLTEILGRRTLIVGPQFVLCFFLLLMGIMGFVPDKEKAGWGIVVFIYMWAIIYQLSIGSTGFVLASEIATLRLRGVTQGLVTITNAVWGLIMMFTVPYMINPDAGNLGGKVGFIFFGTGLVSAVVGYFFYPETKGISFEKLDELYAAKVPPRLFKKMSQATANSEPPNTQVLGADKNSPLTEISYQRSR